MILDEIGRGTSTYDGLSLAWAIVEYLHDQIGCRTLFATHYHELTDLEQTLPRVRNLNVAVKEWQDDVVFLHKIVEGAADKSYGIHVARLAGFPADVNERAKQVLARLEAEHLDGQGRPRIPPPHLDRPARRHPADAVRAGRTSVAGRGARAGCGPADAAPGTAANPTMEATSWTVILLLPVPVGWTSLPATDGASRSSLSTRMANCSTASSVFVLSDE